MISEALHLGIFEQPMKIDLFSKLLGLRKHVNFTEYYYFPALIMQKQIKLIMYFMSENTVF